MTWSDSKNPTYFIHPKIFSRAELSLIQKFLQTPNQTSKTQWYDRQTLYREAFCFDPSTRSFDHLIEPSFPANNSEIDLQPVIDKLSLILIKQAVRDRPKLLSHQDSSIVNLEVYLDQAEVTENNSTGGMFWHQDDIRIPVDHLAEDIHQVPHYSLALLLTDQKGNTWSGGDLVLQTGGHYWPAEGEDRQWVLSTDNPLVRLESKYNQAIIFRNDNAGHQVTPVLLLGGSEQPKVVRRRVLIIGAYFNG